MSYIIQRSPLYFGSTDLPVNFTFNEISVNDGSVNATSTSGKFVGTNVFDYSKDFFEPIIWTMGNYAYDAPPLNPLNGQLWYDTSEGTLKMLDGIDYSSNISDWKSLSEMPFNQFDLDILVDYDDQHRLGGSSSPFNDVHVKNLICTTLSTDTYVFGGTTITGSTLDDLIPSDSDDITNTSTVSGGTAGDSLRYLADNPPVSSVLCESLSVGVGINNITPVTNKRYRVTATSDSTLTLLPNGGEFFQIIREGSSAGTLSLTGGSNVVLQINGQTVTTIGIGIISCYLVNRDTSGEIWEIIGATL